MPCLHPSITHLEPATCCTIWWAWCLHLWHPAAWNPWKQRHNHRVPYSLGIQQIQSSAGNSLALVNCSEHTGPVSWQDVTGKNWQFHFQKCRLCIQRKMPSLHGWTGSYPAYVLFHREKHKLQTEVDFKRCHIFSYHTCSSLFSGQITSTPAGYQPYVAVGVQFSAELPKPLVVQIAAPWTRTLSGVVGEARTKIHTQLPQGCGGFGVDPQRQNMLENSEVKHGSLVMSPWFTSPNH